MTSETKQIEIYYNKKVIILTDIEEDFYIKYKDRKQLKELTNNFFASDYNKLFIYDKNLNVLFRNFKSLFKFEEAAGGLVFNNFNQFLAIKNRGVWQLPKGHVEEMENIEEAAIREVTEETGIDQLTIVKELPSTFHIFEKKGKVVLKRTYWFKMTFRGIKQPVPQTEEGITKAKWIDKKELWDYFSDTYENLKKILSYVN